MRIHNSIQTQNSLCQLELCCAVIFSCSMPGIEQVTSKWKLSWWWWWFSASFRKQPQVNRLHCYPQRYSDECPWLYIACKSGSQGEGQLSCLSGRSINGGPEDRQSLLLLPKEGSRVLLRAHHMSLVQIEQSRRDSTYTCEKETGCLTWGALSPQQVAKVHSLRVWNWPNYQTLQPLDPF